MSQALYRRYRPETFADVIGQEHVTLPLMQALRSDRVNHAYLFSGPRGCGKTTSARILARCLNCAQGPTPEPCGVCDSCVALARGGPGHIDVIEIDAASHGGVDDARELRDKAFFSPASSRFKIYIVDEAHMVSTSGFNALLKIVEEPPPHLKFIFATTEPDKVIGTIRSRTHHYPFRLVPPSRLQDYLAMLTEREGVTAGKGVLPLVVRAGAGSVRDSLSVLDQLMAGAGPEGISYELATSLLGYTDAALLDDVVEAFAAADGAAVFGIVDRVIEGGHDPRRFAEDLLTRLRDLIVLDAVPGAAASILGDLPEDQLDRLTHQASRFGRAELSRAADLISAGLTEMRGATAPRLQLELMCARVLLPGAYDDPASLQSRLERIERRLSVAVPQAGTAAVAQAAAAVAGQAPAPGGEHVAAPGAAPAAGPPAGTRAHASPPVPGAASDRPSAPADRPSPSADGGSASADGQTPADAGQTPADAGPVSGDGGTPPPGRDAAPGTGPAGGPLPPQPDASLPADDGDAIPAPARPVAGPASAAADVPAAPIAAVGVDVHGIRTMWDQVLTAVGATLGKKALSSTLRMNSKVLGLDGRRLTVGFSNAGARDYVQRVSGEEVLRQALIEVLDLDLTIDAVVDPSAGQDGGAGAVASAAAGGGAVAPGAAGGGAAPSGRGSAPETADRRGVAGDDDASAPTGTPPDRGVGGAGGDWESTAAPPARGAERPASTRVRPSARSAPPTEGDTGADAQREAGAARARSGAASVRERAASRRGADDDAGTRRTRPEDDVPSADDPDVEDSGLSGRDLLVRELGATVISETEG